MKKLLLACAAVTLGFGFASAETYTANFTDASSSLNANSFSGSQALTLNSESWNLEVTKGVSNYYFGKDATKGLQIGSKAQYASAVTISTSAFADYTIESVSFELSQASGGKWTGTLSVGDESTTISSLTTSVATYTLDNISVKGGDITLSLTNTAAALYVKNVTVEYSAATDLEAAGMSFPESEYSVKFPSETFTAPTLTKATDALATYTSSDEGVATVDAATGAVTIVKPGTTVITATCEANDRYAKGTAKYTLTVFAAASSFQDLLELAKLDPSGSFQIDCPLTVTFVNGRYLYVVDDKDNAGLIYANKAEDIANYKAGDVLSTEWMVKYSDYNNLPEFIPVSDMPAVASEGASFDVTEVTLAEVDDSMINHMVCIMDVTLPEEMPANTTDGNKTTVVNTTVTNGDTSLIFRNTFGLDAFKAAADKKYNVKGIVSIYKEDIQFLPIEYSVASGVASIEANEGVATYFDLNGRQVKGQLANGIYVKVMNGKASKVVVK